MADKEKLEKVRAEIKRLKEIAEYNLSHSKMDRGAWMQQAFVCTNLLSFIGSMQEEHKKCMYSKDNYTDEDRKVLCDGCEEECKFNKKEEFASEDLEEAADEYAPDFSNSIASKAAVNAIRDAFKAGANWQKEQMMKEAISGHVGQTINGMLRALSDETFGDMGFTAGDKVKLIIIKEE